MCVVPKHCGLKLTCFHPKPRLKKTAHRHCCVVFASNDIDDGVLVTHPPQGRKWMDARIKRANLSASWHKTLSSVIGVEVPSCN